MVFGRKWHHALLLGDPVLFRFLGDVGGQRVPFSYVLKFVKEATDLP